MSGEVQPRKRKDKRKNKRGDEGFKSDDSQDKSSLNDRGDDSDEKNHEEESAHGHHHGPTAGVFSKVVFFVLFAGLLIAVGTVFFQLKGSEIADTPIKQSRYASILENFVDESPPDEHEAEHLHVADEHEDEDEHDEDEGHDTSQQDEHDVEEEHEHKETEHEAEPSQPDDAEERSEAPSEQKAEDIQLEPSIPDEISLPPSEVEENELSEDMEDEEILEIQEADEVPDIEEAVTENIDELQSATEDVSIQEPADEQTVKTESVGEKDDKSSPATEQVDEISSQLDEQHPEESIPTLVEEETKREYTKIIDDVLKEQKEQQAKSSYPAAGITNDYDFEFHEELDDAHRLLNEAPDKAQQVFTHILQKHPKSPRAVYGKALAIDRLSEIHRSNALLEQSIFMYRDVLDLPDVPDDLYLLSGLRCVDRMRFRGYQLKALRVLQRLKERFPKNAEIANQIAVTYLLMSQNDNAKLVLEDVLKTHPNNGFAKAHYGFVLKTSDKDYENAINYLRDGINSEEPGTIDGRFYFHLGDAYTRTGKPEEALKVYQKGVNRGLFLSAYQRSLYNVNSLTARPWWTPEQTTYGSYITFLEKHWKTIRDEAVPLLQDIDQGYFPENEGLKKKGEWKQFEMFARGEKIDVNCNRAPRTCEIISTMPEAAECKRGQVKFSVLLPGTHVWPHTGPTNCRLRSHLGLVVPEGARIRVANETRKWEEGKVIIFDDSFEHEVWHDGDTFRLVLIVDFWHPDLTTSQKQLLSPI